MNDSTKRIFVSLVYAVQIEKKNSFWEKNYAEVEIPYIEMVYLNINMYVENIKGYTQK